MSRLNLPWYGFSLSVLGLLAIPAGALPRPDVLPPLVLWAWENPEDLSFLDPERQGVAVLVGSLDLAGRGVRARSRRQPLAVPAGTAVIAVVRIESDMEDPPELGPQVRRDAVDAVSGWIAKAGYAALQIDFDATVSQRGFYRELARDLRRRLPAHVPLLMTALASWCLGDPWIVDLPVDDATPMLFRMGAEAPSVRRELDAGGDFRVASCRQSVGISTDEPLPRVPADRRVFVFHPGRWTPRAFSRIVRKLEESRP